MRIKNKHQTKPENVASAEKRKRGRPKCNESIPIPNISDPFKRKIIIARIKNNEASRRSRQRRKEMDLALEVECQQLEQKHKDLLEKNANLDKEIQIMWSSYIQKLNSPTAETSSIEFSE